MNLADCFTGEANVQNSLNRVLKNIENFRVFENEVLGFELFEAEPTGENVEPGSRDHGVELGLD